MDALYLLIVAAFVVVAIAYVYVCERLMGDGDE